VSVLKFGKDEGVVGTYCSIQRREIHEQEIPISSVVYLLNGLKLSLDYLAVERGEICGVVAGERVL